MSDLFNKKLEEITDSIIKREFNIDTNEYFMTIIDYSVYNKSALLFSFASVSDADDKFSESFLEDDETNFANKVIPKLITFIENSKQLREMKIGILLKD